MKVDHLSASLVNTFLECPLKYHVIYEEHLREPPSVPAKVGSAVHKTMEKLIKASQNVLFPPNYEDFLPDAIKEHDIAAKHKDVTELVKIAIKWGYAEGLETLVGVEVPFKEPVLTNGLNLVGYIDRLDFNKDTSELVIHDLKTGRNSPTLTEFQREWQPRIYNIAARHLFPDAKTCKIVFWYLKKEKLIIEMSAEDAVRDLAYLTDIGNKILGTVEAKPTPNKYCSWCPHYSKCSAFSTAEECAWVE